MPECSDLRLGGTLSGSGITGGTDINSVGIGVSDWSGLFLQPGLSYTPFYAAGRPGGWLTGDGLPKDRFLTLNMQLTRWSATPATTEAETLWDNTDQFLALLQSPNYLEVDLPDSTSRFIQVVSIDPAFISQPLRTRRISVPLYSAMPYWKAGGAESTDSISGADTLVVGGNAPLLDAVLTFGAAGTFTGPGGWTLTIASLPMGATSVIVDMGARTVVTNTGASADGVFTHSDADWGSFQPGNNSVSATTTVGVAYRSSWV